MDWRYLSLVLLLIIDVANSDQITDNSSLNDTYVVEADKFIQRLFNGYDEKQAPFTDKRMPLEVTVSLYIHHLSISNLENPVVQFNGQLIYTWKDQRIGWNPADFNGKQHALIPFGYTVWTPVLLTLSNGFSSRTPLSSYKATRTYMRISEKDRFQLATLEMLHRLDGSLDCEASGGFPSEILTCIYRIVSRVPYNEIHLLVEDSNMVLKRFDMKDTISPSLNGWEILSATQKIRSYNPFSKKEKISDISPDSVEKLTFRSLVESRLVLRRAGWTLPIVVYLPMILANLLITCCCVLPVRWSLAVLSIVVYILSLIVRDAITCVPSFTSNIPGADLTALFLWISCFISIASHLLLLYFIEGVKRHSTTAAPFFKMLPFFESLETISLKKNDNLSEWPFAVQYIRSIMALIQLFFGIIIIIL